MYPFEFHRVIDGMNDYQPGKQIVYMHGYVREDDTNHFKLSFPSSDITFVWSDVMSLLTFFENVIAQPTRKKQLQLLLTERLKTANEDEKRFLEKIWHIFDDEIEGRFS